MVVRVVFHHFTGRGRIEKLTTRAGRKCNCGLGVRAAISRQIDTYLVRGALQLAGRLRSVQVQGVPSGSNGSIDLWNDPSNSRVSHRQFAKATRQLNSASGRKQDPGSPLLIPHNSAARVGRGCSTGADAVIPLPSPRICPPIGKRLSTSRPRAGRHESPALVLSSACEAGDCGCVLCMHLISPSRRDRNCRAAFRGLLFGNTGRCLVGNHLYTALPQTPGSQCPDGRSQSQGLLYLDDPSDYQSCEVTGRQTIVHRAGPFHIHARTVLATEIERRRLEAGIYGSTARVLTVGIQELVLSMDSDSCRKTCSHVGDQTPDCMQRGGKEEKQTLK